VVSSYSGVRALLDDGRDEARAVTRDYLLYHHDNYVAPMISIFGGKITTYRKLSEQLLDMLADLSGRNLGACETDKHPLPGGDIEGADMGAFTAQLCECYPWAPEKMLRRYMLHYGSRAHDILISAGALNDRGRHFGDDVYEAEIRYLCDHEFAKEMEDILWRRTKLGLHISDQTKVNIEQYLKEHHRE
jgi:glycerol-3-phosphate dehydrogenase